MAPPLKFVLAAAILAVALPQLKAWATGQWFCQRLVPLSITSVATPCTFPCLLISPRYGPHGIVVRQEADGTPCKRIVRRVPDFINVCYAVNRFNETVHKIYSWEAQHRWLASSSLLIQHAEREKLQQGSTEVMRSPLEAYQESHCSYGICQLPGLRPHLKRMKRDTIHSRKRRALAQREKMETENGRNNISDGKKKRRKRRKKRKKRRRRIEKEHQVT